MEGGCVFENGGELFDCGKDRGRNMRARPKSRIVGRLLAVAAAISLLCSLAGAAQPGTASGKGKSKSATSLEPPAQARKPAPRANPASRATPASFTPEMPFGEAIDILRNATKPPVTCSSRPAMPLSTCMPPGNRIPASLCAAAS